MIFFFFIHLVIWFLKFHLFETPTLICWFTSRTRSQQLKPGLPHEWQEASHLGHCLCEQQQKVGLELWYQAIRGQTKYP